VTALRRPDHVVSADPAFERLKLDLGELPVLYDECEIMTTHVGCGVRERVSGSRKITPRIDPHALAIRTDIMSVLASWTDLVVAEHAGAVGLPAREIPTIAAFLATRLDWLSGHPAVADFAEEIGRLADSARAYVASRHIIRIELGPCITPECDATVFAILRSGERSPASGVRCEAGHVWPPSQWLLLAGRLRRFAPEFPADPGARSDAERGTE
jgi:hypothetical protein